MPSAPDPNVFDTVAASISDGALIEWEHVAQQVADDDDSVLDELRLLQKIAQFHQGAQEDSASNKTPDPLGLGRDPADPRTWAHFLILGRIGSGSFGDVYRAHDTKLQCDIALKLMRYDGDSSTNVSRVLKEARLLARVRHSNVVTVYGADQVEGRVGLWMELVRGVTLEDLLQRQGMFSAREASNVGLDLCRAVAAVHRAGLLPGDIKAHNVMREEGGRTVLMDVAFADPSRTKAADVYSLSAVIFRLVANRNPADGTELRALRPDLPEEFVRIIGRGVDPDPKQRFQSEGALEIALTGFLGTQSANTAAEGWLSRFRLLRRNGLRRRLQ